MLTSSLVKTWHTWCPSLLGRGGGFLEDEPRFCIHAEGAPIIGQTLSMLPVLGLNSEKYYVYLGMYSLYLNDLNTKKQIMHFTHIEIYFQVLRGAPIFCKAGLEFETDFLFLTLSIWLTHLMLHWMLGSLHTRAIQLMRAYASF